MKARQKGKVIEVLGGSGLQGRLMSRGIYPGSELVKLSHFAMRGPVTVKIGRSVLALGHGVAHKVILEIE